LFINFLSDSTSLTLQTNLQLISYILERIQHLPINSNEFRLILQTLPDLRIKLENAIRRQYQKRDEKELNQSTKDSISSLSTISQASSISPQIDFSNFKANN